MYVHQPPAKHSLVLSTNRHGNHLLVLSTQRQESGANYENFVISAYPSRYSERLSSPKAPTLHQESPASIVVYKAHNNFMAISLTKLQSLLVSTPPYTEITCLDHLPDAMHEYSSNQSIAPNHTQHTSTNTSKSHPALMSHASSSPHCRS